MTVLQYRFSEIVYRVVKLVHPVPHATINSGVQTGEMFSEYGQHNLKNIQQL